MVFGEYQYRGVGVLNNKSSEGSPCSQVLLKTSPKIQRDQVFAHSIEAVNLLSPVHLLTVLSELWVLWRKLQSQE